MFKIIAVISFLFFIVSCSSTPEQEKRQSLPNWVSSPQIENGIADTACVLASNSFAIDKTEALALARSQLAKTAENKVKVMDKIYQEKKNLAGTVKEEGIFTTTFKNISSLTLRGAKQKKVDYVSIRGRDNLCAMVVLDPASTDSLFKQILSQSGETLDTSTEEELFLEFKADQAQQELSEIN